jgi:hypothetical protein
VGSPVIPLLASFDGWAGGARVLGGRTHGKRSFPCLCSQRESYYGSLYGSLSFPLRSSEGKV